MIEQDPFEKFFDQFSLDELRAQRRRYLELAQEYESRAEAMTALLNIRLRTEAREREASGEEAPPEEESRPEPEGPLSELFRPKKPPLPKAIFAVMETEPEKVWSRDDLLAVLTAKGWQPGGKTPANSLDATLSRLVGTGRLARVDTGMYRLPSGTPGVEAEGSASAGTLL